MYAVGIFKEKNSGGMLFQKYNWLLEEKNKKTKKLIIISN